MLNDGNQTLRWMGPDTFNDGHYWPGVWNHKMQPKELVEQNYVDTHNVQIPWHSFDSINHGNNDSPALEDQSYAFRESHIQNGTFLKMLAVRRGAGSVKCKISSTLERSKCEGIGVQGHCACHDAFRWMGATPWHLGCPLGIPDKTSLTWRPDGTPTLWGSANKLARLAWEGENPKPLSLTTWGDEIDILVQKMTTWNFVQNSGIW